MTTFNDLIKALISCIETGKTCLLVLLFASITACGGGGGGDEGSEPAAATGAVTPTTTTPPTTTPTPDPDPEPAPEPTSLDDLVVAADNAMQAVFQLMISIDINSNKRAYFSLCDDYSVSNMSYEVNFESCRYRGPLIDGQLNADIKVANHNGQMLAVLWFYDGSEPSYQLWQYDAELEQQQLTLN
ncbi:hypothetical protein [Shewanella nanhaiensis]|uniref:Lipoprotein n=1 Tax=Shewanella nanhaiensis TaxID=2864872 RepID=A0ABS7E3K3_9GAMM|nr:hypothetical protein [Shewanella nanhaiensis]MBW8184254.1 hypothetical protein [Shewanella nanhaiensis]